MDRRRASSARLYVVLSWLLTVVTRVSFSAAPSAAAAAATATATAAAAAAPIRLALRHANVSQVSIQLMDWDPVGANDYAGCLFLDLGACRVEPDQDSIPHPGLPTWMPFFLEKPGDSSGELLVSYQVSCCTC